MKFEIQLLLANVLLYSVSRAIPALQPFTESTIWMSLVLGYFGLTVLLNKWIQSAARRSPIQFVTAVNGSTAIKMLLSLAVATFYLVQVGGEFRVHFVMGLFIAFALNTAILVVESQKLSSKDKN